MTDATATRPLRSVADTNVAALRSYIRQAVKRDAKS
jgi:hypothetical protein